MGLFIVNIHGDIEGDFEIISPYVGISTGYWDTNCQGIVFCSKCKKVINHNYDIDYMESHFNFCPKCGADMRGKDE